jgi:ribosomal protein S18 acetylase RimI-like enzyme
MSLLIRCLTPDDAAALRDLRLEALEQAPQAFGSSREEERDLGLEVFSLWATASETSAVFGAFADGRLAGMTGVGRQSRLKTRHKAHIWGVYVSPGLRGQGVARQLLQAALAHAEAMPGVQQVKLSVAAGNAAALALYEGLGFQVYGREPAALCVEGVLVDELLMARPVSRT